MQRIGMLSASIKLQYSGDVYLNDVGDLLASVLEKGRIESQLSNESISEIACDRVTVEDITAQFGDLYTGLGDVHDALDIFEDESIKNLWKLVIDNEACTVFIADSGRVEFSAGPNSPLMVIHNASK